MSDEYLSEHTQLGKTTENIYTYTPSLLCPIPRAMARKELGFEAETLPFNGSDIWTGYEISWLAESGKPEIAIAEFRIPAMSPNIIESKSFKMYLNSFNLSKFEGWGVVEELMTKDISAAAGAPVQVTLLTPQQMLRAGIESPKGTCIDAHDITLEAYLPEASLLQVSEQQVREDVYSDLFRSNCPVTGQPDWATIAISYSGNQIDHASLLRYLVSFRDQAEFHEQCAERIFRDISEQCAPQELTVFARFLRRGGLDINPWRSNVREAPRFQRLSRQ
ncbi:7-cyano-7-deazaguanine reductase [Sinobacterium caligoides]|uniref:NADPH-dependent 7-cyano-7-deazaguanine reductase n=1 Tax=Sinobacterium caligoides TaxID=933926 RepID=A0A3N2DYS4_9GAMM|nr:NADPH-dependent 7-cyano-7-deazaguanine reductase QueF [Sinobacterium caligoides]ROS05016.1 7-cyano-7-deazaguanine reductase [Sinobacterium caligoides]